MRTTLNLDPDVLAAARSIARIEKHSLGEVISDLARSALKPAAHTKTRNGVPLFPRGKTKVRVTMELVNQLRDKDL
jgi:hypothetical protein